MYKSRLDLTNVVRQETNRRRRCSGMEADGLELDDLIQAKPSALVLWFLCHQLLNGSGETLRSTFVSPLDFNSIAIAL